MKGLYYSSKDDFTLREEIIVMTVIITIWWGIIHFLDWLTFDAIVWWVEPLTLFLFIPFLFLFAEFGKNPVNWWPLVWGTKVKLEGNDFMAVWRKEEAYLKYGGPKNVYYNGEYIKFRKKRDAFNYCITYKNL